MPKSIQTRFYAQSKAWEGRSEARFLVHVLTKYYEQRATFSIYNLFPSSHTQVGDLTLTTAVQVNVTSTVTITIGVHLEIHGQSAK